MVMRGQSFISSGLHRCLTDFRKFCLLRHKSRSFSLASSRSLVTTSPKSSSSCWKQFRCQTSASASCKYPKIHDGLRKNFQLRTSGLTCYSGWIRHYCASCWQRHTIINRQIWQFPVPSVTKVVVPSVTQTSVPSITVISRTVVTEKTLAAENPVKTVTSPTKKRVARKKLHDKEVIADHKNMAAYAVGNELFIDQVERALKEQSLYETVKLPVDITDALMATAKYRVDGKAREIFFFEDGSVVCWNMPASERLEVVKFAQKCCEMPYNTQLVLDESEVMSVVSDSVTALKGSTLHIRSDDDTKPEANNTIMEKFAFSNAVSQSVILSMKEVALDFFVESIEPKTEDLRDGKDVLMTRRALNKMLGEIFHLRHDINLRSDFLDTPDVYWEREELEILYKSMCTYLNLPKRTKVMNEKLNYCTQILELFSSQMNDERHVRLEWFIIVLILVEVVFELAHFAERFIDRIQAKRIEQETFLTEEPQDFNLHGNKTR